MAMYFWKCSASVWITLPYVLMGGLLVRQCCAKGLRISGIVAILFLSIPITFVWTLWRRSGTFLRR